MCLDRVLMKFDKADKVEGIGWKVFRLVIENGEHLHPEYKGCSERPTGQWLHERNFRAKRDCLQLRTSFSAAPDNYPIGWHIFGSRSTAYRYASRRDCSESYATRKVKYRDARAIGTQHRRRIIVAKEIFI